MAVRTGNKHGQWRTPVIDQQMNFAALFASVRRITPRFFAAQRRGTTSAVNCLPVPFDFAFLGIELYLCSF